MSDLAHLLTDSMLGRSTLARLESAVELPNWRWPSVVACLNAAIAHDLRDYAVGSAQRRRRFRVQSSSSESLATSLAERFRTELRQAPEESLFVFVDLDQPEPAWVHAFRQNTISPNLFAAIERSGKRLIQLKIQPSRLPPRLRNVEDLAMVLAASNQPAMPLEGLDVLEVEIGTPKLGTLFHRISPGTEMDLTWEGALRFTHRFVRYRNGCAAITFAFPASATFCSPFVGEVSSAKRVNQGAEFGGKFSVADSEVDRAIDAFKRRWSQ